MYRVKPSKPVAVFGAVFGLAIVIFGVLNVHDNSGFIILWAVMGLSIVGFNLWAAFSKNGSTETITSSDGSAPRIPGSNVTPVSSPR
jgi:hypothetical protein